MYHLKKKKLILVLIIKLFYWKCKCSWSLQAQSFVAIKQKIYIYWWLNFQVIPIVSFPQALGWRVNYCSGLSNDLVPRVFTDLTSSVKRERGWLSILILSSLIINEKKTKTGNHYRNGGWKKLITSKFCELLLPWISSRIIVHWQAVSNTTFSILPDIQTPLSRSFLEGCSAQHSP